MDINDKAVRAPLGRARMVSQVTEWGSSYRTTPGLIRLVRGSCEALCNATCHWVFKNLQVETLLMQWIPDGCNQSANPAR